LGAEVRLRDNNTWENATITEVVSATTMTVDTLTNSYPVGSTVGILEFPDPIPLTTSRMACSYILDRLFTAEQSPDVSNYGKTQRNLARNAIDDILTGEVLLFGQEHTGYRFIRGSLMSAYKSPAEVQKGEEKE
jgi:hypothetical protein